MNRTVDIDALLAADELTLVLGGVTYEVQDVNLAVFMMTPKKEAGGDILHEQLAAILKVKKNVLKDVGLRAVAYALKEIRDWVTATGFEEEVSAKKPLDYPLAFAMVASTYGWTHQDILNLTAKQFFLYLRQVDKLNSIKQLRAFEVGLMPQLERVDRMNLFRSYQNALMPIKVDKNEIEDAWEFLRANKRGL